MAAREVGVAVIKPERSATLAALTSAALGLPGIQAHAVTAMTEAQGNATYGHYQESDNRMHVDVYHGDFVVPITDRLEFSYSIDQDTYGGATPAYSLPVTMTNQVRYNQGNPIKADVITAASGGVTASGLTVLGGLNTYKKFIDARQQAEANFIANNPRPPDPPSIPSIPSDVMIDFNGLTAGAIYGKANGTPTADGNCVTVNSSSCFYQNGMLVGTIYESNPAANNSSHLHRGGPTIDRNIYYHADSGGIYIRAQDGSAFGVNSLLFMAPIDTINGSNPNTGPNAYWEILGFNKAIDPSLSSGNGTSYTTRVAYQTVLNGYDGNLTLDPSFKNVNGLWIHYTGFASTPPPTSGVDFKLAVDNISLSGVTTTITKTQEQIAWENELTKQATIAQYRAILDSMVPANTKVVQRFQEMPLETRTQPVFGAKYYLENSVIGLSGGYSNEPDFQSTFGKVNYTHEFNDKHTTATFAYSLTSNDISRSTDNAVHSTSHHSSDPAHNPTDYSPLNESSTFQAFNLTIAQVVSKNTMLQLSGNFTNQNGYLTNPYKFVYVRGEITPEEYYYLSTANTAGDVNWKSITNLEVVGTELFRENRPRQRNQGSVSLGISQHIPALNASVNADYRFYSDEWDINSHTFELKWYQPLPFGLIVTPNIRYYSQSQAYFFAPYFLEPRADGFYSSDFRLSSYGTISGGISIAKKFTKGISLQAGFEYYTHAGNLKLGGGGEDSYADYSYYLVHANLNFSLSAPGFMSSEGHHHHHHEGAPPPAGLMFAHMMPQADDIMVGYRYTYTDQSGRMFSGENSVDNSVLSLRGCQNYLCLSKPHDMIMHMHMFELMYAPTDWLNLMVMPQLMDMSMDSSPLFSNVQDTHGAAGHVSNGLGDTIMMTLVKVFDTPSHHIHAGIGVSAPTGDVQMTMNGQSIYTTGSELQDYGMQLGSGTWDFMPNVTYTGLKDNFSWGIQMSGIKRMEGHNISGYSLGDVFQSTAWASYKPFNWFSTSVRGIYTWQGAINGQFNAAHSYSSPVDFPSNYGGKFWDVGLGLNLSAPDTQYAGHNLSVEWLQPVSYDYNGYQLERVGSLAATWTYSF